MISLFSSVHFRCLPYHSHQSSFFAVPSSDWDGPSTRLAPASTQSFLSPSPQSLSRTHSSPPRSSASSAHTASALPPPYQFPWFWPLIQTPKGYCSLWSYSVPESTGLSNLTAEKLSLLAQRLLKSSIGDTDLCWMSLSTVRYRQISKSLLASLRLKLLA